MGDEIIDAHTLLQEPGRRTEAMISSRVQGVSSGKVGRATVAWTARIETDCQRAGPRYCCEGSACTPGQHHPPAGAGSSSMHWAAPRGGGDVPHGGQPCGRCISLTVAALPRKAVVACGAAARAVGRPARCRCDDPRAPQPAILSDQLAQHAEPTTASLAQTELSATGPSGWCWARVPRSPLRRDAVGNGMAFAQRWSKYCDGPRPSHPIAPLCSLYAGPHADEARATMLPPGSGKGIATSGPGGAFANNGHAGSTFLGADADDDALG